MEWIECRAERMRKRVWGQPRSARVGTRHRVVREDNWLHGLGKEVMEEAVTLSLRYEWSGGVSKGAERMHGHVRNPNTFGTTWHVWGQTMV